jgi:hypothetical protein
MIGYGKSVDILDFRWQLCFWGELGDRFVWIDQISRLCNDT